MKSLKIGIGCDAYSFLRHVTAVSEGHVFLFLITHRICHLWHLVTVIFLSELFKYPPKSELNLSKTFQNINEETKPE